MVRHDDGEGGGFMCSKGRQERRGVLLARKRWLPVMVIKYGLICGGVIWVAFFLIVVSLGLESPSALAAALILELGLGAP